MNSGSLNVQDGNGDSLECRKVMDLTHPTTVELNARWMVLDPFHQLGYRSVDPALLSRLYNRGLDLGSIRLLQRLDGNDLQAGLAG